jgi:hypothetical protein
MTKNLVLPKIKPWKEYSPFAKKNPHPLAVLCRHKIGEVIARIEFEEEKNTKMEEILTCLHLPVTLHEKIKMSIFMFNDAIELSQQRPKCKLYYHGNVQFE